jgi:hypothetical protein
MRSEQAETKPYIVSDDRGFQSLQVSPNVRRIPIRQPETIEEAEMMGGYVAPGFQRRTEIQ